MECKKMHSMNNIKQMVPSIFASNPNFSVHFLDDCKAHGNRGF